ncbi:MAG: glycosyltransferase [Cellulophaga sp.]
MQKILLIGFLWPEPNATAAGGRMLQLIQFFKQQKYQITFASTSTENEHTDNLSKLGINTQSIVLNDASFDEFIWNLLPNIVLFDRFMIEEQFGWRVAKHVPNAIRILDTEDLHSLRATRQEAHKESISFSIEDWKKNTITKREIASIYRCDLSLIISSFEMELLTKELKVDNQLLFHLPFMLPQIEMIETEKWKSFENRKNFICIGNGKHAPNLDAINWLKKEIWPRIHKQLPKSELHIYGAYLPESVQQMHKPKEGFYIMGRAEVAIDVLEEVRVNLAPLRFGAGIKGKLVDGMHSGTPSITTTIGAEGMHGNLPWNGMITDKAEHFANVAVELYLNKEKWNKMQQNGVSINNKYYEKNTLHKAFLDKINALKRDISNHRLQNFIGTMLLHHSLASTKYMSRWIEEKNKSK